MRGGGIFILLLPSCEACSVRQLDLSTLPQKVGFSYGLIGYPKAPPKGRSDQFVMLDLPPDDVAVLNPVWYPRIYLVATTGRFKRAQNPSQDLESFIRSAYED